METREHFAKWEPMGWKWICDIDNDENVDVATGLRNAGYPFQFEFTGSEYDPDGYYLDRLLETGEHFGPFTYLWHSLGDRSAGCYIFAFQDALAAAKARLLLF